MRMGRMGRLAYLADGTQVSVNSDGSVTPIPQGVPSGYGGGNVQGKGLVFQYQTPLGTSLTSLAPGAAATATIQFDQNSIFCWLRTTLSSDIAGAVETSSSYVLPLITVQISDTGSGMSFMNSPIPLFAIAGTAQLPYVLPTPQFIQSNASYQFQFTNYAASTTYNNVRLQLHGYRIFNSAAGQ